MGMTSARTWAHSIFPQYPFQTAPGQYDENGLKALDYVIDSARRHGIKLVLSFIDNWKYYNGVDQYVDWCGPARTQPLPKDSTGGDTDTHVRGSEARYGIVVFRVRWLLICGFQAVKCLPQKI